MEEGSKIDTYLLSFTNSWESHENISDISVYLHSLLTERNQITNTSSSGLSIIEDSKIDIYLLGFGNSWEPYKKICDFSNSLISRRDQIKKASYFEVEGECSSGVKVYETSTPVEKKCYKSPSCVKEFKWKDHLSDHMRLHTRM